MRLREFLYFPLPICQNAVFFWPVYFRVRIYDFVLIEEYTGQRKAMFSLILFYPVKENCLGNCLNCRNKWTNLLSVIFGNISAWELKIEIGFGWLGRFGLISIFLRFVDDTLLKLPNSESRIFREIRLLWGSSLGVPFTITLFTSFWSLIVNFWSTTLTQWLLAFNIDALHVT